MNNGLCLFLRAFQNRKKNKREWIIKNKTGFYLIVKENPTSNRVNFPNMNDFHSLPLRHSKTKAKFHRRQTLMYENKIHNHKGSQFSFGFKTIIVYLFTYLFIFIKHCHHELLYSQLRTSNLKPLHMPKQEEQELQIH